MFMDITAILSEFINRLKAEGFSNHTIRSYHKHLDQFRVYLAARHINDIKHITCNTVLDYQAIVMAQPVATETKAMKLRAVRRLFGYLVENRKLLIDPTDGLLKLRRKARKIGVVLTAEEIERLRDQPDLTRNAHIRNRAMIELMYSAGVRISELLNLNLGDADRDENVLYIWNGKGGKDRVVPLSKPARTHLARYLCEARPWYTKKKPREKRLFVNRSGLPFTAINVRAFLRKYRITAGIEKSVSPHTLRRTCATHFLKQGADIRYVQELLGHQRLSTTQAYTRLIPSDIKDIHNRTHPGRNIQNPPIKKKNGGNHDD